jgi:predicted alpha/beta hydrolase family esterase
MTPTILFVPGLRGHVADHWQSLLAARLPGSRTVPPRETDGLKRDLRVDALDREINALEGPVVLVAHSAGVMITAHWAATRWRADAPWNIRGALLAAPADLEAPLPAGYPTLAEIEAGGWLPVPRAPLPFHALVGASRNDPLCAFNRSAGLARDWACDLVDLGEVGHLNPAAGFGEWPEGPALIARVAGG